MKRAAGLGGLVKLGTTPQVGEASMPNTCRASGRSARSTSSPASPTAATDAGLDPRVYSSSPNDYKYTNHDKKINIYDEEKNIIGQYHPRNATDRVRSRTCTCCRRYITTP